MTIGMEVLENENVQLTEQNFRDLCRLCLRADDDFIVDVFSHIDATNSTKRLLVDRINELYQIKVSKVNIQHKKK